MSEGDDRGAPDLAATDPAEGLFFVVGTGRCGSTLLQAMLLSHSRIAIPPETFFFAELDPAIAFTDPLAGAEIDAYVAYCAVQPHWESLGIPEEELAAAVHAGARTARAIFCWLMQRLVGDGARKARWGEKTPRHEQCIARIRETFPGARFIHIHRDPRDVVASLREMDWRSGDSVGDLAKEIRRTYQRQLRAAAEIGPGSYLRVRFEDLVGDPEKTLRGVCAFLGEPFEPGMLDYATRSERGYAAEESAWKDRTLQPLDPTRAGRFMQSLTPREIRRIEHVLAAELGPLGYEPARAPTWRPDWWWVDVRLALRGSRRRRPAGARDEN